ncbi:MAG TPA: response regulator [Rhodocyclaceae bacterium]|nr:response regulator [Rhodocyclaceae bacterium]
MTFERSPAVQSSGDEEKRPTLLLVDDEENILSALKRLLRRDGYRILTAGSGQQGLAILDSDKVDVIISDQRMPHMTGIEFLRQAKERCPDSIRMVLSGYTDLETVTSAINQGDIYRFLTKPWEDDDLRANIEEAFLRKAIIDENVRLHRDVTQTNAELAIANARLEQLLREKQQRIRIDETTLQVSQEVFQHLPWPVLGIDENGLISVANQAAFEFFGSSPLVGSFIKEVLPAPWEAAATSCEDGDMLVQHGAQTCLLLWRNMGASSLSQGRLLVISPCKSCAATRISGEAGTVLCNVPSTPSP